MNASLVSVGLSSSLLILRLWSIQENVRSTTHLLPLLGPQLQDFFWSRFARTFDEIHTPPQDLLHPTSAFLFTPITSVHPQMRKAREQLTNALQERFDPLLVQNFRAMNLGFED